MKVAALGPKELLSGLAAFGVKIFHTTDAASALETVAGIRAEAEPYGIIFISENLVSKLNEEEYETLLGSDLPVVLTIPDLASAPDAGLENLATLAKRAVGVDIFNK